MKMHRELNVLFMDSLSGGRKAMAAVNPVEVSSITCGGCMRCDGATDKLNCPGSIECMSKH
jgi:hypothetical protein